MDNELKRLKKTAVQIRRDIIEATSHGKGGGIHVGPALSSVDLVTALYFKIMTVNPENPEWMQRDRFILSKGHAYAVWYSALAEKGFFPREELLTMRAINSRLQGHPAFRKTPGVDMTSGSLGNGLACGNLMPGPGSKAPGNGANDNWRAWRSIKLNMDTIFPDEPVDTSIEFLGRHFSMPLFSAPVGSL